MSTFVRSALFLLAAALAAPLVSAVCPAAEPAPRNYLFFRAPLEVFDSLADLKLDQPPAMPPAERELLTKVWQWRVLQSAANEQPDNALLVDAMLSASGVADESARANYRQQLAQLVAAAKEASQDANDDRQRGEKLLAELHGGVMSKGYDDDQTSLAAVFDTGKYNCVSACALYYLVGTELGLKLTPISIPGSAFLTGHASLDLVDGSARIQVEPTNPDGFDWGAKVKKPGVRVVGFVPDRSKGHEVDPLGLAALIFVNRGIALQKAKEPQRMPAARCYLAALVLDPSNRTAANNLRSIFGNWAPELVAAKKFEDAIRLLTFARSFDPKSDELQRNLVHAYAKYIDDTLAAGQDEDALALIRRAAAAVPSEKDFSNPSIWFVHRGEQVIKEQGYEAGLAVVDRGLAQLSAADGRSLRQWRSAVLRRWSQELIDKGDLDGSLKVLARGQALDPKDAEISRGIAYHTQKALVRLDTGNGAGLVEHFQSLRHQFPDVKEIGDVGFAHAGRAVQRLADAGKFDVALAAMDRYQPLLTESKQRAELGGIVYGLWGRQLAAERKWRPALDKYAEGLKAYPHQPHLLSGLAATIDEWAKPAINAKDWEEVVRIYDVGLREYLPGDKHLANNRAYCEAMRKKQDAPKSNQR